MVDDLPDIGRVDEELCSGVVVTFTVSHDGYLYTIAIR